MGLPVAGTVSRRRFTRDVIPALIAGLAIALPWLAHPGMHTNFDGLIRHRASAERIGRRYLATLPAATDRSRLLAMSPAIGSALQAIRHRPEVAAGLLRRGINDDFSRADTVIVDGWVLAATEARLCAVIALA
jgi:hypothetical protein